MGKIGHLHLLARGGVLKQQRRPRPLLARIFRTMPKSATEKNCVAVAHFRLNHFHARMNCARPVKNRRRRSLSSMQPALVRNFLEVLPMVCEPLIN